MAACAGLMLGALLTTLVELLLLATLAELLLRVALWPALPFGLVRGCDDDRLAFTFAGRFCALEQTRWGWDRIMLGLLQEGKHQGGKVGSGISAVKSCNCKWQ